MSSRDDELDYAEEKALILEELASVGVVLTDLWSNRQIETMSAAALRIILKHLALDYPSRLRQALVAALTRRDARDVAWSDLLNIYRRLSNEKFDYSLKERVADALSRMARPSDLDEVIGLISNPGNGSSRVMFVVNLSRSRSEKALQTLVGLRNEPDLQFEIGRVLKGKIKRAKLSGRAM